MYLGAQYCDGRRCLRRWVTLLADQGGIQIVDDEGRVVGMWDWQRLAVDPGSPPLTPMMIRPRDGSGASLRLDQPGVAAALMACQPQPRRHKLTASVRLWLWVLTFLTAAAALPLAARPVALLVPESWESRLGDQVMATANVAPCLGSDGNRALGELASRLARPLIMKRAASIVVLPGPTRNAYALPGGKIIIYQGLIAAAPNAEALAGVLAHELAHLETRDPAAALLRAFITRTLWALLLGDLPAPSILISALMQGSHAAHYSRAQEWRADRRALELLAEADVDSSELGEFLETQAKKQGRAPGMLHRVLASHPAADRRAALAREQASAGQPALGEGQWRAVRRLCDEAQNMSMR